MFDFTLVLLWVAYTIMCFVIYHKIFRVYYFGSVAKGIMSEIISCVIVSTFLTALTLWFWFVAVIILVIAIFVIRGKLEDPAAKNLATILMAVLIVLVVISGRTVRKNGSSSDADSISENGIFMTEEEQEAAAVEEAEAEASAQEQEDYVANHVITCDGETPVVFFESNPTLKQIEDEFGTFDEIQVGSTPECYYDYQVYVGDLQGQYVIETEANGILIDAYWQCVSDDIDQCTELINKWVAYYNGKYGEYVKSEWESSSMTSYDWYISVEEDEDSYEIYAASIGIVMNGSSMTLTVSQDNTEDFFEEAGFEYTFETYARDDGTELVVFLDEMECEVEYLQEEYPIYFKYMKFADYDTIYYDSGKIYEDAYGVEIYSDLSLTVDIKDGGMSIEVTQTGTIDGHSDLDFSGTYTLASFTDEDDEYADTYDEYETYENEYILPNSDTEYLDMDDLQGLTADDCRIARNEIYARYGLMFADESLQDHFNQCSWYEGTIEPGNFDSSILSDIEEANLDLIVEYEKDMGYRE